jgi:hypothetical protein
VWLLRKSQEEVGKHTTYYDAPATNRAQPRSESCSSMGPLLLEGVGPKLGPTILEALVTLGSIPSHPSHPRQLRALVDPN